MQAVETQIDKGQSAVEMPAETPEAVPEEAAPEPIDAPELNLDPVEDLDVDNLFSQKVDESAFDDMFTEEEMSQENVFISKGNNVSFDDAMNLGILDE
jgi:hypothetical protein